MDEKEKQQRVDEIFLQACDISEAQLEEFLEAACGDDAEVRGEVERLLAADRELKSESQVLAGSPFDDLAKEVQQAVSEADDHAKEIAAGAADRNLLFGIVALQMNFINRDALVRAMNAWVLSKTTPIESILLANRDMGEKTNVLLKAVVDKHLEYHNQNPEKSLQTMSTVTGLMQELKNIQDPELDQSLARLESEQRSDADTPTISFGEQSKRGGRFRVLRPHRQGGLGAVSVAIDEELNREVALKEIRKEFSEYKTARDRLRVEAEITGGLEHPSIVPVYGLGTHADGSPFYCMRFIKGDSLKDAIRAFHETKDSLPATSLNLELRNLLRRFIDVCDAVSYAHSRRVLHRDLKPGNIMLGKYGETLVVDWGLAKATAMDRECSEDTEKPMVPRSGSTAAPTMAGSTIGTPEYMSPEQAEGRIDELGPATDVYSLGATLYCLLTGRPPIHEKSNEEKLRKVRNAEFSRPCELEKDIPKPLEAVCLKAMEKDPTNRYETASALSTDIERWLADERVLAYAEPWVNLAARSIRKNRTATASISVATLVAFLGLLGMNMISRSKNREIQAKNFEIERQNVELVATNSRLVESRKTIVANFRSFRTLTAAMIKKAENDLSQQPGMTETRNWLTQKSLEIYGEFQRSSPEELITNSISSRIWVSQLHRYGANLRRNASELEESLATYTIAIEILDEVLKEAPQDPEGIGFLSETLRDFATTLDLKGDLKEANRSALKALLLSNTLLDKFPESLNCQRLHATNSMEISKLHFDQNDIASSLDSASTSVNLLMPIVQNDDARARDEQILVFALLQQSTCLRELKQILEARSAVDKAVELVRGRVEEADQRGNNHTLARAILEKAKVEMAASRGDAAVDDFIEEATKVWNSLADEFPEFVTYQRYLAKAHIEHAMLLSFRDKHAAASKQVEVATSIARVLIEKQPESFMDLELLGETLIEHSALESHLGNEEYALQLISEAVLHLEAASAAAPELKSIVKKLGIAKKRLSYLETR